MSEAEISISNYKRTSILITPQRHHSTILLFCIFSDSVTLHWHGQHQRGTPYMDGIGYVSQCPIASGQSFTYQFKVSKSVHL